MITFGDKKLKNISYLGDFLRNIKLDNEKLIKYVDVLNPNSSHAVQKIKELMRGPQC